MTPVVPVPAKPDEPESDVDSYSAQLAMVRVQSFVNGNPYDSAGIVERLRAVVAEFPGTPTAVEVAKKIAAYESNGGINPMAVEFEGHWYLTVRTPLVWQEAREISRQLGGHLVTITSEAEADFVEKLARDAGISVWLGLTDESEEGTWKWVTGEAVTVTRWSGEQPDDADDMGGEDHVHIWDVAGYKWNDANGTNAPGGVFPGFVCEWDRVPNSGDKAAPTDPSAYGSVAFGGHRYKIVDRSLSWHQARDECVRMAGHLVTITSQREQEFVAGLVRPRNRPIWIGLSDERQEGTYEWVTGEEFRYANWSDGDPNNWEEKEHYGLLRQDLNYMWNDAAVEGWGGGATPLFVCEWDR